MIHSLSTPRDLRLFMDHLARIVRVMSKSAHSPLPPESISFLAALDDIAALREIGRQNALTIMQRDGEIMPTFTFYRRTGASMSVSLYMPEERRMQFMLGMMICGLLNIAKIDAYMLSAEMWMSAVDPKELGGETLARPSLRPNRQEIVRQMIGMPIHFETSQFDIVRAADGRVRDLVLQELHEPGVKVKHAAFNPIQSNLFDFDKHVRENGMSPIVDEGITPDLLAKLMGERK